MYISKIHNYVSNKDSYGSEDKPIQNKYIHSYFHKDWKQKTNKNLILFNKTTSKAQIVYLALLLPGLSDNLRRLKANLRSKRKPQTVT